MKKLLLGLFLLLPLACWPQVPERAKVSDAVLVSSASGRVTLSSVLAGKRTMVLAVDIASTKASLWIEQLKSPNASTARENTVVVLAYLPEQQPRAAELIRVTPGIRFVEDPGFEAVQLLKLSGLPTMLGIAPNGTIVWRQTGDLPGTRSVLDVIDSWMRAAMVKL